MKITRDNGRLVYIGLGARVGTEKEEEKHTQNSTDDKQKDIRGHEAGD